MSWKGRNTQSHKWFIVLTCSKLVQLFDEAWGMKSGVEKGTLKVLNDPFSSAQKFEKWIKFSCMHTREACDQGYSGTVLFSLLCCFQLRPILFTPQNWKNIKRKIHSWRWRWCSKYCSLILTRRGAWARLFWCVMGQCWSCDGDAQNIPFCSYLELPCALLILRHNSFE